MQPSHLSHPKYRPDIDGLRAIAVLSVIGYHYFPSLINGGFIGVDVFFVISGYLISTIIFGSLKNEAFSFSRFYSRRILRIFPALILVLSFCLVFGWFALLDDEYKQLGKHIAGGASFVSNFVLWDESGYFDNAAETKPLLHLWSLGIEEQFYLAWPLLIWAAYKLRLNFLSITVAVAAISFYLNIETAAIDPVADFYAPQTRFWELMLGSLLAWLTISKPRLFTEKSASHQQSKNAYCIDYFRSLVSLFAVAVVAYGFWTINKHDIYPAAWATIPVASAVLIIAVGPKAWINRSVLSNRILVWIGLISFPLYLWHWPLLSFARILESDVPSLEIRVGAIFISFALAWLTYRYVESPIRTTSYAAAKAIILTILMSVVGVAGYYIYSHDGLAFRKAVQQVASQVQDLNFKTERMTGWRCNELNYEKSRCSYTTESPTVVVIGDSHAPRIYSGLTDYYNSKGKGVAIFGGGGGCPPLLNVVVKDNKGKDRNCVQRTTESLIKIINDPTIKEVVFASRESLYTTSTEFDDPDGSKYGRWAISLANEPSDARTNAEVYALALAQTFDALTTSGKQITYLYGVPELGFDIKSCIPTRPISLSNKVRDPCAVSKTSYEKRNQAFKEQIGQILAARPSIHAIDLSEALCDENFCYGAKDGVLFYTDDNHLSHRGAAYIVNRLSNKFN